MCLASLHSCSHSQLSPIHKLNTLFTHLCLSESSLHLFQSLCHSICKFIDQFEFWLYLLRFEAHVRVLWICLGVTIVPIILMLASENSKISFKLLVEMFGLAIGLWVISYWCCKFNSQYVIKFPSELSNKLRALIWKNYPRESMVFQTSWKKKKATPSVLIMVWVGIQCTCLLTLLMMFMITPYPWESRSSMIKLTLMTFYCFSGVLEGWSFLKGQWCCSFVQLHRSQAFT
jgi:hypothetical protein